MKLYHGSGNKHLVLKSQYPSRYGITALFLTDNIELANNFAKSKYGQLYEVDVQEPNVRIDFGAKSTYQNNQDFTKILKYYKNMGYPAIKIINCLDSPNIKLSKPVLSTIVVVFNINIVKAIKKIDTRRR